MKKKKKFKMSKRGKIAIIIFIFIILIMNSIISSILYTFSDTYKLLELDYTEEEVETILNKTSDKEASFITNLEYNKETPIFLNQRYFIFDNLERYLIYSEEHTSDDLKEVVSLVNSNRDILAYKEVKETDTSLDNLMLVNKYYALDDKYVPDNIVSVSSAHAYGKNSLTEQTYNAFKEMSSDASKEDLTLIITSGYISYDEQEEIYNDIKETSSIGYADTVAARPGHSEHQTGLSIDLTTYKPSSTKFSETDEYEWLIDNAHKYGFIIRYPEESNHITGFNFESGHFRYVGKDTATKINRLDITLDEYYAYYIENK